MYRSVQTNLTNERNHLLAHFVRASRFLSLPSLSVEAVAAFAVPEPALDKCTDEIANRFAWRISLSVGNDDNFTLFSHWETRLNAPIISY